MKYERAKDYLFRQLPMFQREGPKAFRKDLTNIRQLASLLDHPEQKFNSIHVAGTNGKGTVAHMLSAMFQSAGYKTGLYTSPHYRDFRERIKINGQMIPESEVINFVEWFCKHEGSFDASFFEISVAMAFKYFADEQVDIAIVEVGLGGRLDSTNIIIPELAVITNIGWDHTQFLGNSLKKIAYEKAGIIKDNVPVLIGEYQPGPARVFEEVASDRNAPLTFAADLVKCKPSSGDLFYRNYKVTEKQSKKRYSLTVNVHGEYQHNNVTTSLAAVLLINEMTPYKIGREAVLKGMKRLREMTAYIGRWQVLNEKPLVLCDSAHNREGVQYLVNELLQFKAEKLHIVWGMVGDKDPRPVLSQLPTDALYYFAKADIPRGMPASSLLSKGREMGLRGETYSSVRQAYGAAIEKAGQDDLIFIGGSVFTVAEVV